jgi:hypothetical protein
LSGRFFMGQSFLNPDQVELREKATNLYQQHKTYALFQIS